MDKILGVFGVGLGDFRLLLERHDYAVGESVLGLVRFSLTRPLEGKKLTVGLRASQKVTRQVPKSGSTGPTTERSTEVLHDYSVELDGEREYSQGEYPFKLYIPPEVLHGGPVLPDGVIGDIGRVIAFLGPTKRGSVEWEVWAKLTVPWKNGPAQRLKISVRRDMPSPVPGHPTHGSGGRCPPSPPLPSSSWGIPVGPPACSKCGDTSHRPSARFCCNCGNKL